MNTFLVFLQQCINVRAKKSIFVYIVHFILFFRYVYISFQQQQLHRHHHQPIEWMKNKTLFTNSIDHVQWQLIAKKKKAKKNWEKITYEICIKEENKSRNFKFDLVEFLIPTMKICYI